MEKRRYETPRTETFIIAGERILNFVSETTKDNFSKKQDFSLWTDDEDSEEEETAGNKSKSLWED